MFERALPHAYVCMRTYATFNYQRQRSLCKTSIAHTAHPRHPVSYGRECIAVSDEIDSLKFTEIHKQVHKQGAVVSNFTAIAITIVMIIFKCLTTVILFGMCVAPSGM